MHAYINTHTCTHTYTYTPQPAVNWNDQQKAKAIEILLTEVGFKQMGLPGFIIQQTLLSVVCCFHVVVVARVICALMTMCVHNMNKSYLHILDFLICFYLSVLTFTCCYFESGVIAYLSQTSVQYICSSNGHIQWYLYRNCSRGDFHAVWKT